MTASRVAPSSDRGAISQDGAIQALGFGGLLAAGAVLAVTALELPLICPLRLTTGIPCPLCGMTTATTSLLRGEAASSFSANPFAPAVVVGAVAGFLDGIGRMKGRQSLVGWLSRRRSLRRSALPLLISSALASWIFQLFRFDVL